MIQRERVQQGNQNQVGSPMTGAIVEVTAKEGMTVKEGQPLCIISAAKMETVVSAPKSGLLKRVIVKKGETLHTGDLLVEIE